MGSNNGISVTSLRGSGEGGISINFTGLLGRCENVVIKTILRLCEGGVKARLTTAILLFDMKVRLTTIFTSSRIGVCTEGLDNSLHCF